MNRSNFPLAMQVKQSPDAAKAFACFLNGFTDFRKVIPNV